MPAFLQFVATLREQMQAELTRSDVLRVLIWPILILIFAFVAAVSLAGPAWVLYGVAAFAGVFLTLYLLAFVFLLFTDRDALRSEKYSLQKLAIEHGLLGDSTHGIIGQPASPKLLQNDLNPPAEEEK